MKDFVFREWVPIGSFAKVSVGLVSSIVLCVSAITIVTGVAFKYPFLIVVLGAVMAFLLLLFRNYRGIQIQMSKEWLLINYGVFNHKFIPLGDVVSCEPTKASFRKYGGVGVRLGIDGSWAYTTSFGKAVRIISKRGRPFVFSTGNPEKICNILTEMKSGYAPHTMRTCKKSRAQEEGWTGKNSINV